MIDVAVVHGPGPARLAVLDSAGSLLFLDAGFKPLDPVGTPAAGACLVSARGENGGVGLVSADVSNATVGSFIGSDSLQIVLASGEELLLFDLESGVERFRAHWPGLAVVRAGDLDGDDRDELVVIAGKQITVLGAPRVPQQVTSVP